MKNLFLALCLFSGLHSGSQSITEYYDWQWKLCEPSLARFIAIIDQTDSGWNRRDIFLATKKLQMKGLYKDRACTIENGWFRFYYANEKLSSEGQYINRKKDGLWISYHHNGMMQDSIVYYEGKPAGTSMSWYPNGYMSDSSVYNNGDLSVHIHWFDNGLPSYAGKRSAGKKEGKWQYFHNNGRLAAEEEYKEDRLISRIYYNETGKQVADTADKDREAEFRGGAEKWRSFLENKLQFPNNVQLLNTDVITVVIAATVDEDGNISDAYVHIPFNYLFDEEALRVMKKSPKWVPAISHNRRIKSYIRQPVSFSQQ